MRLAIADTSRRSPRTTAQGCFGDRKLARIEYFKCEPDGFGFIEEVRSDPQHRGVPILVLTTESDAETKTRARMAGATGWIVKPFNPVKLVDAIRRVAA